jgi:hypothetical protein
MLDARREEGLVVGSGWLGDAVWAWLSGVYALAHLQIGDPSRAAHVLYAYADHAAPTGTWVEEQSVRTKGTRTGGDVSDAEQSGIFLALVRSMIALERHDSLELLAGVPSHWLHPDGVIELKNSFTRYGPVTFRLTITGDGKQVHIACDAVDGRRSHGGVILHLATLKSLGYHLSGGGTLPDRMVWGWRMPKTLSLTKETNP